MTSYTTLVNVQVETTDKVSAFIAERSGANGGEFYEQCKGLIDENDREGLISKLLEKLDVVLSIEDAAELESCFQAIYSTIYTMGDMKESVDSVKLIVASLSSSSEQASAKARLTGLVALFNMVLSVDAKICTLQAVFDLAGKSRQVAAIAHFYYRFDAWADSLQLSTEQRRPLLASLSQALLAFAESSEASSPTKPSTSTTTTNSSSSSGVKSSKSTGKHHHHQSTVAVPAAAVTAVAGAGLGVKQVTPSEMALGALIKYLKTFNSGGTATFFPVELEGSIKQALVKAIKSAPKAFEQRLDLLEAFNNQALKGEVRSLVALLRVICDGSLSAFEAFKADSAHTAAIATAAAVDIDLQEIERCVRLLALCSLAAEKHTAVSTQSALVTLSTSSSSASGGAAAVAAAAAAAGGEGVGAGGRVLSYGVIAAALKVPVQEVEMWVIDAVSEDLLEAKIDQMKECVAITRYAHCSFGPAQWRALQAKLLILRNNTKTALAQLASSKTIG